jgi:rod shape-determining protein MreC
MIKIFQRLGYQFKEYIILIVFVLISLISISQSEKPQAKKLKIFAIGSFAVVDELANAVISIFTPDVSREQLKYENAQLMLRLSKLRNAAQENEELRAMIAMKDTSKFPLISAKIVSKLISKIQGNFIINRGSNSGIMRGMPVINHQGLVGLIMEVSSNYSVVRNLQNTNLNIAVTVQKKNIDGILSFDGRTLIIKNIPTTYDVEVNDKIVTSDFSSVFPPSIPVGTILKKETTVLGLLHTLTVKPAADIEATNNLFVIGIIPGKEINQLEMNLLKKP